MLFKGKQKIVAEKTAKKDSIDYKLKMWVLGSKCATKLFPSILSEIEWENFFPCLTSECLLCTITSPSKNIGAVILCHFPNAARDPSWQYEQAISGRTYGGIGSMPTDNFSSSSVVVVVVFGSSHFCLVQHPQSLAIGAAEGGRKNDTENNRKLKL